MNNNKSSKFEDYVKTISSDRNKIVKANRKYYDETTALYINRKISQKRSLELIINALVLNNSKDVKKALLKLNKFKGNAPNVGIKIILLFNFFFHKLLRCCNSFSTNNFRL